MPTLNQIKATRQHSATDRAIISEGRLFQRRLRAAMRKHPGSRLTDLARMLQRYRQGGFPSDMQWFLADYAAAINSEIKFANWRAK